MSAGPSVVVQVLGPSTGGIRVHVAALADGLRRCGVDAPVVGPAGVLDGVGPQAGIVPVPAGLSPLGLWQARRALRPWSAASDVVHAHGLKAGWVCIRGRPRRPVVLTLHNVVLDEGRSASARIRRRLERDVLRQVDRVVVPTRRMAAELTAIPPGRVRVVAPVAPAPQPVRSRAEIRAGWGVGDDTPVVVCVARLHPQKDLGTLLEAWVQVTRAVPEARLVVVGEGPARHEVETAVERSGLSGAVHLAGFSPHAVDELAAADVAAVTSRWEAIPFVLVEAMQLGLPVVSTDVGLAPELLGSGEGGRCVPVGDADAIADALVELLTAPPALRRQVGETARRIATELAGPEQLVRGVLDVYRELV